MITENEILELRAWAKFGKLIGGLIHNLNAPLQGLSGNSELLQMMDPDNKIAPRLLRECDRLDGILQGLGYIFEKDANNLDCEISIIDFFKRIEVFYCSNLNFKHKFTKQYDIDENCTLKINNKTFLNVVSEIYSGILSALPDGGSIFIKLTNCNSIIINVTAENDFEIEDQYLKYSQKWIEKVNGKINYEKKVAEAIFTIEY